MFRRRLRNIRKMATVLALSSATSACASAKPTATTPPKPIKPALPKPPAQLSATPPSEPEPAPPIASAPEGSIGTNAPLVLEAASPDGRWTAYCQAREDNDQNGKLEVMVGPRGELTGDTLKPYLALSGEPERAIDLFVGADPTGKYILYLREQKLILLDTTQNSELDLTSLGADTRFDNAPYRMHRVLSFDRTGERLLYVRRNGASRAQIVVRTLKDGIEQTYDPGPGELWRAELEPSGGYIFVEHVREDTNKDRRVTWPVPAINNPSVLRCRGPLQTFPRYSDYGDRPEPTLIPLSGGLPRLSHDLATPLGNEIVIRDAAGALWIERTGGNIPLNSSKCAARIQHADPVRRLLVVGCVRRRGKRDLYLSTQGFIKNLKISVAETELDQWPNGAPRLVALYPGADVALLDMDQRDLLPLRRGDLILNTHEQTALVRRGSSLLFYDTTTRAETAIPGKLEKNPDILTSGPITFISPNVIDLTTRSLLGTSTQRPLALSHDGNMLIAESEPSASNVPRGPLKWQTPSPPQITE